MKKPKTIFFGLAILTLGSIVLLILNHHKSVAGINGSFKIEVITSLEGIEANKPVNLVYIIEDSDGNTVKDFEIVHEKLMHFIVIRKDLQQFQHIHPSFDNDTGEFSIPVTFMTDGEYRIFADFTPSSGLIMGNHENPPVTIYKDITVANLANYKPEALGSIEDSKTFNGYTITMDSGELKSKNSSEITFDLQKDGIPVTHLEPYLGALGHTVVLREGDLMFVHSHPQQTLTDIQTGKVTFVIKFPETGNYKLFSQFQVDDEIITSDFLVNVSEIGEATSNSMH